MHKSPQEARAYVTAFLPEAESLVASVDIVLLAPFIDLECVCDALSGSTIGFGAQDCFWEREGAFTGEVSASMLKKIGCSHCVVGHSERRRLFGDTDETVGRKVTALLAEDITPIVCVGESLDENRAGRTAERVQEQLRAGLGYLSDAERAVLVIAYEPVWAIGTGLADNPKSANNTIQTIRSAAGGLGEARILYGGSMTAENSAAFCAESDIDGGLVGSASLDPNKFVRLIASATQVFDAR